MAFGKNQLMNPTPANTSLILDIISGVSGALITAVNTAPFIPTNITSIISWILGTAITVSLVIKPFFGVKIIGDSVPADKVTSMEQPSPPLPYNAPNDLTSKN